MFFVFQNWKILNYRYALYTPEIGLEGGKFTIDHLDEALSGRANIYVNLENKVFYFWKEKF